MNYQIIKYFRFIPPEIAHYIFVKILQMEIIERKYFHENLKISLWGKTFSNPVGLAAGFDKNAESISGLFSLGFGFVEVGTITPLLQKGNPKPRVFRIPEYESVIQRLGFNNLGAKNALKNLKKCSKIKNNILGINIGKNSFTKDPLKDYLHLLETFGKYSDYIVLNISSPNTPGLRDLQKKENIKNFLENIKKKNNTQKPILIKISPDLLDSDLENICDLAKNTNFIDGIIVSNTTISRKMFGTKSIKNSWKIHEYGGMSGPPLFDLSNKILAKVYLETQGKVPIIGVGGVSSAQDAFEKIALGASLVQLYTALIYKGPNIVIEILEGLTKILKKKGFKNLKSAIGSKLKK